MSNPMNNEEHCSNCRFANTWRKEMRQASGGGWVDELAAVCMRYPPTIPNLSSGNPNHFPPVDPMAWCGEYQSMTSVAEVQIKEILHD